MESEYITSIPDEPNPEAVNAKLSDDFFNNTQFIAENGNKLTDDELLFNLSQFQKPNDLIMRSKDGYYESEEVYKPKESNPYKLLLSIKTDLIRVKNEIDQSVKCYHDCSPIAEIELSPYSYRALDEVVTSKKTVDAFINYNLFNREEAEEGEDDEDGLKPLDIENNKENLIYSSYERYRRLTNNLISQVKQLDNALCNEDEEKGRIEYKVIMNKATEVEEMSNTLAELDERLTYMERTVGDWELHKSFETIAKYLLDLVYYNEELTENSDYKIRHEALKMIDAVLNEFNTQFKVGIDYAKMYSQMTEYYHIYETATMFKPVFEYIQVRLKTIKDICTRLNVFKSSFALLNEKIESNEKQYAMLMANFNETISVFKELEQTLREVNDIDKEISSKVNE